MHPLTVPGTLDALQAIANYVITVATEIGLDKKSTYRLRLAVDEVATNIILHGYQASGVQGNLQINAAFDESKLEIVIEDTTPLYDPYQTEAQISAQDPSRPLEDRSLGGLGLYLAIHGVDQFSYERLGNRNRTLFVVHHTLAISEESATRTLQNPEHP
jgi:serine/threonine-protein kinase RsbW